jgi:hypothetical protein
MKPLAAWTLLSSDITGKVLMLSGFVLLDRLSVWKDGG